MRDDNVFVKSGSVQGEYQALEQFYSCHMPLQYMLGIIGWAKEYDSKFDSIHISVENKKMEIKWLGFQVIFSKWI